MVHNRKYSFYTFMVTQNIAQYLLDHVTYAPVKFEAAASNCLGWDAFTRKWIIWPWTFTQNIAQYM